MSIDIGSIIVRTPDVRGGKPHIAGIGMTVHRIVRWYKQGHNPEQIADEYSHVTLAQVYAALSYYHANQAEIEAELASEDADIAARLTDTAVCLLNSSKHSSGRSPSCVRRGGEEIQSMGNGVATGAEVALKFACSAVGRGGARVASRGGKASISLRSPKLLSTYVGQHL
ncbi:MAG: DUF433 domain-containing protein [Verrucomicrobia bacterium]|nr:MAG: DUF433 domain-containing protein [Verrucomicrobiota bacterium]